MTQETTSATTDSLQGENVSTATDAEQDQLSLRSRSLRASAFLLGSKPLNMVITLVRSMVLTRLLFPEAFGLMALVQVVSQGIQMFSDIGIGPSIIQNKRGSDPEFLRTAWTLGVIRGFCLWLAICLLAWPMAKFFNEPMLVWMLPVTGLGSIISGFNTTAWSTNSRSMRYGRITAINLAVPIVNLVSVVALAWYLQNVWALVIGNLIASLLYLLAGHFFLPGIQHRFRLERVALREILRFGKWVFIGTILAFFAAQGDKMLLGKLVSLEMLGIYSIASVLAMQIQGLAIPLTSGILFPVVAEKARTQPNYWAAKALRARLVVLKIGLLSSLGVAIVSPAFFQLFYDPRYWEAGRLTQWLALSMWFTVLWLTTGNILLALGNSRLVAIANAVNMAVTITSAIIGYRMFELPGFILGYALGTLCGEVVGGLALHQRGAGVLRQDVRLTLVGTGAYAVVYGIQQQFFGSAEEDLLAGTAVGILAVAGVAFCWLPGLQREFFPNFRWRQSINRLTGRAA